MRCIKPVWAAIVLFLGCFIEGLSLMVLTMPVLYPLIIEIGFDGIWFGIVFVTLLKIGMVTPPVGINVYVAAAVFSNGLPPGTEGAQFLQSRLFRTELPDCWHAARSG